MSTINPAWPVLWSACALTAVGAAVRLARRPSFKAHLLGRTAVGVLFVFGGALMHVINLATGGSYRDFADPAHFGWITSTWRSVVPPNQTALISLLAAFELTGRTPDPQRWAQSPARIGRGDSVPRLPLDLRLDGDRVLPRHDPRPGGAPDGRAACGRGRRS